MKLKTNFILWDYDISNKPFDMMRISNLSVGVAAAEEEVEEEVRRLADRKLAEHRPPVHSRRVAHNRQVVHNSSCSHFGSPGLHCHFR